MTDEEWRRFFEVNVLASVRLMREYLPGMMRRGYRRVVSIASDSAVVNPAEMIHYGMSKTALLAASRFSWCEASLEPCRRDSGLR
ncbi:SDR family oxidoreductase [Microbacterium suwonense]|uniref:SDR family oxidoreductase n=1 Tax=Microbacterium suwonense TaxID=683047 RepID=UPI0025730474|nr:SDR family oxidoreductase [Microbacterium suwonense]